MLTNKEVDVLIDALTAWESKDLAGDLMSSLFTSILTKDDPESKAKMEAKEEERRLKSERETRERKEQSMLLKAKLIQIKQANLVEETGKLIAT